uniref:PAGE family member 4 n=1 Tax=Lynx canadensis TaxID=61383 RepID=A0A667IHM0_LYNCA
MSARVRSRSRGKGDGKKSSKQEEPVVPGEKTSQQKELPTENPDIETGQEKEGAPVAQEPELESETQGMGLEKTGAEHVDCPEVERKTPPNPAPAKIPEACDEQSY